MTDYSIVSRFRNKDQVEELVFKLKEKGKSCYNFCEEPADPFNPEADPEEQMKKFEAVQDFTEDEHFKKVFAQDLEGLKNAREVILLLPAGTSSHIEIGIAYGLGKKCILIGEPKKPESLYLLFSEYHKNVDDFLNSVN